MDDVRVEAVNEGRGDRVFTESGSACVDGLIHLFVGGSVSGRMGRHLLEGTLGGEHVEPGGGLVIHGGAAQDAESSLAKTTHLEGGFIIGGRVST